MSAERDRAIERIREWAQALTPEWRAVAEWQIRKGLLDREHLNAYSLPIKGLDFVVDGREVGWTNVWINLIHFKAAPSVPAWLATKIAEDATTPAVTPQVTPAVRQPIAPEPLPSVEKALEIVHGAREQEYGHPADDLRRIGLLWTTHLAGRRKPVSLDDPLTAREVCVLMILLKGARLARTPDHADSLADVVGYVVCSDRIGNREAAR